MNQMTNYLGLLFLFLLFGCKQDPQVVHQKYFESGQEYYESGRYEEAVIQFRNALQVNPGHIQTYLELAKTLQQLDDHTGAATIYQRIIKLDSRNVEANLQLGRYMLGAGNQNPDIFKQVQGMAEEVLKEDPTNVDARILLGNAYVGLNDLDNSLMEMQKALEISPDNLNAYLAMGSIELRQQQFDKAESTFMEALRKHPESLQAHLALATFYAAVKKPQEAEEYLKKAFDLSPADPGSLYALVNYYLGTKREAEAENVFKEAIARKPEAREPRWGLANFYLQRSRIDEGINSLQAILKANPRDRQVELRLAEVFIEQGKVEETKAIIEKLLALDKNDPEAHYFHGRILFAAGEKDKALQEFELAIKFKDWWIPPYMDKAMLLADKGDFEGALSSLNEVLRRDGNNLQARAALAKVLTSQQRFQDALQQSQQVLDVQPNNEDALAARGEALRGLGRFKESKVEFQKLCDLQPENYFYWHRLGLIELFQNDSATAKVHLRKALELKPDFTDAINDLVYLHLKTKKYEDALQELDSLSKRSPVQDVIHNFKGIVYIAQGNQNAARDEFRKAIEINPQNYQAYLFLGQANIENKDVQEALKAVDQLISRDSSYAPAYLQKGYYLQAANDEDGAIANYRKAIELDPGNAVAANNLAWLLCVKDINLDEALSLAQAARKKEPDNPEIADTLGWIYYKRKNNILAVDQLLFSVNNRQQPNAEHYYRLGMAYYAKGDLTLAKQTLRKALELSSSFEGAEEAKRILKMTG